MNTCLPCRNDDLKCTSDEEIGGGTCQKLGRFCSWIKTWRIRLWLNVLVLECSRLNQCNEIFQDALVVNSIQSHTSRMPTTELEKCKSGQHFTQTMDDRCRTS